MKNNTCPNCGAAMAINGLFFHCDYCGTEVDSMGEIIVHVEHPKIKVAQSKVRFDKDFADSAAKELVEKYIKMNLCEKIAEFLFDNDCVDIDSTYDPVQRQYIFRSKFRYVDKGEKL